jgi:hypothetical protein
MEELLEEMYRTQEKVFTSLEIIKDFDNAVASLFLLHWP